MKTIQLEEFGLTPLDQCTMKEISGGHIDIAYKVGEAVGKAVKGAAVVIGLIAIVIL